MNAIIAAATGYAAGKLEVFLSSVERHCANTKVFLIVSKHETVASLASKYQCLEFVHLHKPKILRIGTYPLLRPIVSYLSLNDYSTINPLAKRLGRYPLHIALERYFIALDLVRTYGNSLSNILLTDSRDVVIQRDPFNFINNNLISGVEPRTVGGCPYTSSWVQKIYGQAIFHEMLDRGSVCSGITLGTSKNVENYLIEMCSEIWKRLPKIGCASGFDQGIHNYLIFKGKFPIELTNNQAGLIATLGWEDSINFQPAHELLQVHDKYPAIVHQYDRYPDLVEFFKSISR
jgi:hypothetical protein